MSVKKSRKFNQLQRKAWEDRSEIYNYQKLDTVPKEFQQLVDAEMNANAHLLEYLLHQIAVRDREILALVTKLADK